MICWLAGLDFGGIGPAAFAAAASPPSARVLTVSAATDSYPYSFRDESGRLTGYAVDLLDAVAETMGVKLERIAVPAAEDVRNLETGRCDIAQFHAPIPGRESPAAYSQTVLVNRGDIFVRRSTRGITSLADLRATAGRIATPQQGRDFLIAEGFAPSRIQLGTAGQCLTALAAGEVDAVVLTRLTGLSQLHYLRLRNIVPVGASLPGFKVAYSIAVRRGDTELLALINEALATLSVTGRTEEIYLRWFGRFEPPRISPLQISLVVAGSLGLALAIALWALRRQRTLRRQLAAQAAELRESQRILDAAQQFARLGNWHRDARTGAVQWSAETFRIFERDPARPPASVDELVTLAAGSDRDRWRAAIEAGTRDGQPYDLDLAIAPAPGIRKIIHVNARPLLDAAGRVTGVFGTVQDITAPRAAEAALRRSEQLLRALYANLPLGLGVVERDGDDWQVVSLNPTAIDYLGLAVGPDAPRPLHASTLAPEWQEFWRRLFTDCLAADRALSRELIRSDLRRVFSAVAIPLEPADDRPRLCFLAEDVTERRRQDAEIAQGRRLRAIGELVGGIAHEFNNLLTPIRLATELIRADWAHDRALVAQLKVILDAAARSTQLVQRLLTLGRQTDRRPEIFALPAVVDANLELLRPASDRRIVMHASLPADLPTLFLPTGAVHQVLLNLLLNARDTLEEKLAAPPAGWTPRIEIEAALAPAAAAAPIGIEPQATARAWVRLTVRDNGRGMPPEVIERLFEPFYSTKEVGRGTGLGLATVWHLVTGFGGRVEVESTLGQGSAFHVVLPVYPHSGASPVAAPAAAAAAVRPQRRFLLIDDEETIAQLVATVLRRRGDQVTPVTSSPAAWSTLAARPGDFDAVILDLNMPGLNGVEFARRARALPFTRPMIVMSGRVTDADRAALAAVGITTVLAKPFQLDELTAALAQAMKA